MTTFSRKMGYLYSFACWNGAILWALLISEFYAFFSGYIFIIMMISIYSPANSLLRTHRYLIYLLLMIALSAGTNSLVALLPNSRLSIVLLTGIIGIVFAYKFLGSGFYPLEKKVDE